MDPASGVSFPVVFFDGEHESSLGNVDVFPTLDFKALQLILSDRTGLFSHQFSVYLADCETRVSVRVPITQKTNFLAVSRQKNCCFLVVLKRSRRERRRKTHEMMPDSYSMHNQNDNRFDPPPNLMLLRRDGNSVAINGSNNTKNSINNGFSDFELGRVGYERRVMELQMDKERYMTSMRQSPEQLILGQKECADCERENRTGAGFHSCINDPIVFGFRTKSGPITRPVKKSSRDSLFC